MKLEDIRDVWRLREPWLVLPSLLMIEDFKPSILSEPWYNFDLKIDFSPWMPVNLLISAFNHLNSQFSDRKLIPKAMNAGVTVPGWHRDRGAAFGLDAVTEAISWFWIEYDRESRDDNPFDVGKFFARDHNLMGYRLLNGWYFGKRDACVAPVFPKPGRGRVVMEGRESVGLIDESGTKYVITDRMIGAEGLLFTFLSRSVKYIGHEWDKP